MEKIAELERRLKNHQNHPETLQGNRIRTHQHPRVIMEAEIDRPGTSRNINRSTLQDFSQIRTKPPVFDGTSTWSSYLKQFELVAEMNKWSQHQKALHLATSLKGEAQSILDDLDSDQLRNYSALVNKVNQRFGSEHQTEVFRAILRNRVRQPRETIPQLAHEIRKLVKLAYPTREHGLLDDLTKEHFVNSLPDADTRWKIHQSRPRNLDESVRIAVELEAFQMAEQHRTSNRKVVRVITAENDVSSFQTEDDIACRQTDIMMDDLPKILETMSLQLEQLQDRKPSYNSNRRSSYDSKRGPRRCYRCDDPTHIIRNCPHPPHQRDTDNQRPENQNSR
jgi:hypothetical protein